MTANIKINTFHDSNVESIEDDVNDENNAIFFSSAQQTAINRIELAQSFTKGQGSPYMLAEELQTSTVLLGPLDA